ncbi:MAG: hypothetical protein LUG66_10170 [Clostridiales bacterium]|nr:hypothetical protein [Clostridiales bacterium]
MKKLYEKPKFEKVVINTEAIADTTPLSAATVKQSQYNTLNISSKTVEYY